MRTLKTLDQAGLDLRLWCYACQRAATIDAIVWMKFEARGWPIEVEAARRHFRCKSCRSSRDVLIVATKRPKRDISNAAVDLVAGYFHALRSAAKRRRREY